MKISPKALVRLIVEADKGGYSRAVKHSDQAYDECAADFREAQSRLRDEYEKDLAEAEERASAVETEAFDRGYAYARSEARDANNPEALANAKSRAYEEGYAKAQEEAHKVGYQRGLAEGLAEGETHAAEGAYNSGLEAGVKAERERALAAEPKLSVWFKPCGPSPKPPEAYPPLIDKIKAIKAIRETYGSGEGYGLKEVKDLVETFNFGARVVCGKPLPQAKAVTLYLQLQAAGFDPVLKS